jgi:hypothetical protein
MTTVHDNALTTIATGLSVWPASTAEARPGDVTVGGVSLAEVADRFGTRSTSSTSSSAGSPWTTSAAAT